MGTKIRDLSDVATTVGDNDFFVVATSDNKTKKITGSNLRSSIAGGAGISVASSQFGHMKTWSGNTGFANHSGTLLWLNAPYNWNAGNIIDWAVVAIPRVEHAGYYVGGPPGTATAQTSLSGVAQIITGNTAKGLPGLAVWRNQYGISTQGNVPYSTPRGDSQYHFLAF